MFTVYAKPNCSFCVKAKMLLSQRGIPFETIYVASAEAKQAMLDRIEQSGNPPPRMVPQIFNDEEYIGGYDQLRHRLGTNV